MNSGNTRNPRWKIFLDLHGVGPENGIGGDRVPAASQRDTKDGTVGFSPQLAGHAKANHSNTSSFDAGPPNYTLPGYPSSKETAPGQEEGGRKRQPTTSIAGRVLEKEA